MMNDDNHLYVRIAEELNTNSVDKALWTRAFAEAEGEPEKAKAAYIRLRFAELQKVSRETATQRQLEEKMAKSAAELRKRIQSKLAINKRATLYGALGLLPTSSDTEVANRINEITRNSMDSGKPAAAELKYAIDIIGDDYAREEYDRKLWEMLNPASRIVLQETSAPSMDSDSVFLHWWQSKTVTAIVAATIVLLFGYLAKGMFEVKGSQEVQKESVKIKNQAANATEKIGLGQVENQRVDIQERSRAADRAHERSVELENRRIAMQEAAERRRLNELENRRIAEAEREELRRKEQERRNKLQEDRRAEGERKYWTCMRSRLESGYSNSNASSACSGYRRI